MPVASTIAAIAAVAGAVTAGVGAVGQAKSAKQASAASRRAEQARNRQMQLETMRKQRTIFRDQMRQRSVALANTTNQGASAEGSSALPGGYGQIAGETGRQSVALAENANIGQQIFDANAAMATAQGNQAMWQGVGTIGQQLFQNSQAIGRIGNTMMAGQGGWVTQVRNGQGYVI